MNVQNCVCNICDRHIVCNRDGLQDGVTLLTKEDPHTGLHNVFTMSLRHEGKIHLCNYCIRGLRHLFYGDPLSEP